MGDEMPESRRENVLLDGRLAGMGYKAPCAVLAVKVSLPELGVCEYVTCDIQKAPAGLPDGRYEVSFEGRSMDVKKLDGDWLSGGV